MSQPATVPDRYFEKTLGDLVKAVRHHVRVSSALETRLADALRLRNFLAHDLFRERIELFVTQEGRQILLGEIAAMTNTFSEIDTELDELMNKYLAAVGIDQARLDREVEELKAKARAVS